MNLRVSIDDPILDVGEHFEVRYRKLPSGSWVSFGNVFENEFVIPSLDEGTYEVGISFKGCDEAIVTATVPPDPATPCYCPEIASIVINESCTGQHMLVVTFDEDVEFNACTYRVFHSSGALTPPDVIKLNPDGSMPINTTAYTDYDTMTNPFTMPVTSTANQRFGLAVYCCETNEWLTCHQTTKVTDINPCTCSSILAITEATYTELPGGQTRVDYVFSGSNPNLPPYSGRVYDGFNSHTFTVASSGVNQVVVPFTLSHPATLELTNRCGTDRVEIESTEPPCESDPEITNAIRLAWNGFLYPATGGYAFTMTFAENDTVPAGGYVIEVFDPSAPSGSQVVVTQAVSTPGDYIIPIQKQYYTLDILMVRVVSLCATSNEEVIQWI